MSRNNQIFYENNRTIYENNRHIFQELKHRIMGKNNLSGPNAGAAAWVLRTSSAGSVQKSTDPFQAMGENQLNIRAGIQA